MTAVYTVKLYNILITLRIVNIYSEAKRVIIFTNNQVLLLIILNSKNQSEQSILI